MNEPIETQEPTTTSTDEPTAQPVDSPPVDQPETPPTDNPPAGNGQPSEPATETPDLGVKPEVPGDNMPTVPDPIIEPKQPEARVIEKILARTRYTWDIYHVGNERFAAFTLSLIETDPDQVAKKFWAILAGNVADRNISSYKPRLKSIEVLS